MTSSYVVGHEITHFPTINTQGGPSVGGQPVHVGLHVLLNSRRYRDANSLFLPDQPRPGELPLTTRFRSPSRHGPRLVQSFDPEIQGLRSPRFQECVPPST